MTSQQRDFDRLARAWLEFGPNEAPDRPIAAVLQAIETTPQVRRPWRWPTWRSSTMSRITILAVLAGTIALLVGGLVLSGGSTSDTPPAVVAPTATPVSPSPAPAVAALPSGVAGGWVAPSRGTTIENLTSGPQQALGGNAAVTTVVFVSSADWAPGPGFWLDRRGTPLLASAVQEESPGILRFTMKTSADPNCVGKDSGTYHWSVSDDGQWLTLDPIEDACETRAEILDGTWQRSLAHDSTGGPGISAIFDPYLTFTLPPADYLGRGLSSGYELVVDSVDGQRTFKVWKDLDGFVDPCDRSRGRLGLEPGMDAFLEYLRTDPRFTITKETEFQIDGHRAVEVLFQLGKDISAPCWDFDGDPANKTGVLLWIPRDDPNLDAFWNGEIDTPGIVTVTEVDGVTLAFEAVNVLPNDDLTSDRAVLDTVRFVDALPSPPPG